MLKYSTLARLVLATTTTIAALACTAAPPETDDVASTHQQFCADGTCWDCAEIPVPGGTSTYCEAPCSGGDGTSYDCPAGGTHDGTCPPPASTPEGGGYSHEGTDAGGAKPGSGGGGKCHIEEGKRACTAPPKCAKGTHPGPDDTCVSDTPSCGCEDGGAGTYDGGATPPSGGGGGGGGCTLTQGFWKNHAGAWAVSSLVIGGVSYPKAELLTLFRTAPSGDASLILAHQLEAAMLNAASGASQVQAGAVIADAQAWMASHKDADGRLPYGVSSSSAEGAAAVAISSKLDTYNNGGFDIPHCK